MFVFSVADYDGRKCLDIADDMGNRKLSKYLREVAPEGAWGEEDNQDFDDVEVFVDEQPNHQNDDDDVKGNADKQRFFFFF